MIPGAFAGNITSNANNPDKLGEIGDVFGGGNAADVYGNTTINIGTAETVTVNSMTYDETTKEYTAGTADVKGAYITGNVYGGGNLAGVGLFDLANDVSLITGNTYVNICAIPDPDESDATIYKEMTGDERKIKSALRERGTENLFWIEIFTPDVEKEIKFTIERMHGLFDGSKPFVPTKNPKKCHSCRFKNKCEHAK
jgi:hypothetical protein